MTSTRNALPICLSLVLVSVLLDTNPLRGQDLLCISEFAAANSGPYADEDGEYSDWIEIYNAGTNTVDLDGWYLTDSAADLNKWKFPSTNMGPNSYLVVFASGKNRRTPGAPLHTNFKLDAGGEYLALIKPDALTVVSGYVPSYSPQVAHVSYGIPLQQLKSTILSAGATTRVLVPSDDILGYTWTDPEFDDSSWLLALTGVGFDAETQGSFTPVTIADSVTEFSGQQGANNWFYGYWDKTADANALYSANEFTAFPNAPGSFSSNNFWNGATWSWFNGSPPWTQLTADGGHPSANDGNPSLPDHWAIRRYVSETAGPLKITGHLEHTASVSRDWVYVTASGTAANSMLYVYLTSVGDGYIDDMKLVAGSVAEAGPNLLPNGDFETGLLTPWTIGSDGNLAGSTIVNDVQHSGEYCLHLVATAGGTTQASAIWQSISPALTSGQTYTLSFWYRPGNAPAPLTVRFSGGWINTSFTPVVCGDGTVARIFVDGVQVFQRTVFGNQSDYSVNMTANLGSHIDFALDPGNNDYCDASTFTAQIETADPGDILVADSLADWSLTGTQGEKNWVYGYYNRSTDPDRVYQFTNFNAFPRANAPWGSSNYWTGSSWNWPSGDPPWTEIQQTYLHPNGVNNAVEHWVIRRWISQVGGRLTVDWTLAKDNPNCGGGVTGHVFHNGVEMDVVTIPYSDALGVARSVVITNVQVGDFIDFAVDPNGTGSSTDDSCDGTRLTATIRGRPSLGGEVTTDIAAFMIGSNSTAYIRIPFTVTDPSAYQFLSLRMKYDDGFVAYLNGTAVANANSPAAPTPLTWNSTATTVRPDVDAVQFQDFDLTASIGLLRPGTNVLAVHGLNPSPLDLDFLILPELVAASVTADLSNRVYFAEPTPGVANGIGSTNMGPLVVSVQHTPNEPSDDENLYVTAQVIPSFRAITNVTLTYRVMYLSEITIPMFDDGLHADGLSRDGIWGGIIPAGASTPGQMVRYFVYATDSTGNGTRFPAYLDAVNSPQYNGTVVSDPGIVTQLPVFQMFIQNPTAADNATGTKCSLFFLGRFYDNCGINIHGQSSSGFPKKSYDIDMNPGYGFVYKEGERTVDDLNFMSTYGDKSYMRNILGYDAYKEAGAGYHWVFPIRVQQNGLFHSVANLMENGDANYVERLGLDPNGALYKMYNQFNTSGSTAIGINVNAEKKSRKNEGNADLVALYNGVSQTGQAQVNYVYDHIDIPSAIGFLAGHVLANDEDCCHKNYYFYCDTEGTGEWRILPWDVDLSFGHTWTSAYNYFDPRIYATNCYSSQTSLGIGGGNNFLNALLNNPAIYQMYLRRVRTITDEQLQPPNIHPYLLKYENMINTLAAQMEPDAALDYAKWGTWSPVQNLARAVEDLNVNYLPLRRRWIYNTLASPGQPTDPYTTSWPYIPPQPTNVVITFGALDFNPAYGDQAQEYVQLVNTNPFPVDISDWKIIGAIEHVIRRGTVIPSNSAMYLSPDVNAFRARPISPHGGQGLFVQGNYKGQLSARGELLQIVNKNGAIIYATNYVGAPTLPQQYLRITEIMYHPAVSRPSDGIDADQFEYLELKNIGPVSLDLVGVHFVNGIDFTFTNGGAVTAAPGQSLVLVKNANAFRARYGPGPLIAGQYTGSLDNAGENLRLDDARGEKILDFSYDNKWYPITDGAGFSLVIVNEGAAWNTWGLKESWRPSGQMSGSPGAGDPASPVLVPVLINEILTHSDTNLVAGLQDAVELFNPTSTDADIGGWFISDDFTNAFKYRIPNGTILPAGCYRVFTESDFNPGGLGFALSGNGDEAFLFSGDANTNLTGYIHGFHFDAAENGITFGRYLNSLGDEHFVAQQTRTLGTNNSGPLVGPIVISEIMYHPPDFADGSDNQDGEFIELRNLTTTNVSLFHPFFSTNTWQLRGGVDFVFPRDITLAPNSRLLIVSFDPTNAAMADAFRTLYQVPADVSILGPYQGKLANNFDHLLLYKPDPTVPTRTPPYVLVDEVEYTDQPPWPTAADGIGASLRRISLSQYGNDPINWAAAVPTAGRDPEGGTAPVITAQPLPQQVVAFNPVTFSVSVSGSAPLSYQWRRDGQNIPGATNQQLTFSPEPLSDALLSVAVFNSAGSTFSSNALLTVLLPAQILSQPQDQTVFPGTANITFKVVAASTSALQYQWRHDGIDIPNATSATYTIPIVQPSDAGVYTVLITDAVGSVSSAPAQLDLILHPMFTRQPTSATITIGSTPVNQTFFAQASSSTPVRYQWLYNENPILNATNASFTVINVQMSHAGDYAVVASDTYGSITSTTAVLVVVTKATWVQHPSSLTVFSGEDAQFAAAGSGTLPISFRWRRTVGTVTTTITNGLPILGLPERYPVIEIYPSNSVLTLTNVSYLNDGDRITAVMTNVAGGGLPSSVSSYATLTVLYAPLVASPLTNVVVGLGSNAVITNVVIRANPSCTYEWWHNGTNLLLSVTNMPPTNMQIASLMLTNVQEVNEGDYSILASNLYGMSTTVVATVSLRRPPVILEPPASQNVMAGDTVQFGVLVSGSPPFSYHWRFFGTNLPVAIGTNANLTLTNVQVAQQGDYSVVVSNFLGSVTSVVATLTITVNPDSDSDGIPDAWTQQYFGHPTGTAGDLSRATDDADGDGMINRDEYLAGTIPTDQQSYLRLTANLGLPGSVILEFNAVSNRVYSVFWRTSLVNTTWIKLQDIEAAPANRSIRVTNTPPANQDRFYRLEIPGSP